MLRIPGRLLFRVCEKFDGAMDLWVGLGVLAEDSSTVTGFWLSVICAHFGNPMLLFEEGSRFVVTRNVPAQHIDDSIFLREGITLSALMSRWGCGDGYLPRMLTPLEYVRAGRTHTITAIRIFSGWPWFYLSIILCVDGINQVTFLCQTEVPAPSPHLSNYGKSLSFQYDSRLFVFSWFHWILLNEHLSHNGAKILQKFASSLLYAPPHSSHNMVRETNFPRIPLCIICSPCALQ